MRWWCLVALVGCAGSHPWDHYDGSTDRSLSLVNDDLSGPQELGLGGADLAGPPGSDLATSSTDLSGCGLSSLAINEVQTGGGTATDEWVELYNRCVSPVVLTGAKLVYRSAAASTDSRTLVTFSGTTIAGRGWLLIAGPGYTGSVTADVAYTGSGLAANGGGLGLRDTSGALVDSMGWGTATNAFVQTAPAPPPPSSQSIGRHPDGSHSNNDNSLDFTVATTPTPRAMN